MEMISLTEKQKNVLQAFKAGNHLTVQKAFQLCRTTELRKIVSRLRRKGFVIKTYQVHGERYLHYYLMQTDRSA